MKMDSKSRCAGGKPAAVLRNRAVKKLEKFGNRGMEGLSAIIDRIAGFEQKIQGSKLNPVRKARALVALFLIKKMVWEQEAEEGNRGRPEWAGTASVYQDASQWFDRCGNSRYPR